MLGRSARFLRMLRTLAYAPVNRPPRMITIPPEASKMYEELLESPNWARETFYDDNMEMPTRCGTPLKTILVGFQLKN